MSLRSRWIAVYIYVIDAISDADNIVCGRPLCRSDTVNLWYKP